MKFKYLNELADIVVNIDEDKNIFDGNVIGITEHAIRLIAQMKRVALGDESDVLYFADGHIVFNANTETRLFDANGLVAIQPAWLTSGGTPLINEWVYAQPPATYNRPGYIFYDAFRPMGWQ
jgi:hypothetical protein